MAEADYIKIIDSFNARSIYHAVEFYRLDKTHTEIKLLKSSADNEEHIWREKVLEFTELKTIVKLTYYSHPSKISRKLPVNTLELEISGDSEARKKTIEKLEQITGIEKLKKNLI